MKKFLILFAVMFALAGCGPTADNTASGSTEETTEESPDGRPVADIKNPEELFTDGDFAIYGESGIAILYLGMAKADAEQRLESFGENFGEFTVTYSNKVTAKPNQNAVIEELVNYVRYEGYRNPVYTSKGIYTTGVKGMKDKCSPVEDVIEAYGIDVENESYTENYHDDKNYCITLLYDGNDERIISPKDTELSKVEDAKRSIRFIVNDGVVRGIDFYQHSWE